MPIRDALAWHYRAHALPPDGGASDPWFRVRIGPVTLRLPNPPARRRAVVFHDINHIVTGYDTLFAGGEMAIAAFEVGAGCGRFGIAWFLNLTMFALGLFGQPRGVLAAFVRGQRSASIYHRTDDIAALTAMSVSEVRTLLRVGQVQQPAHATDLVRFAAWAAVAFLVLIAPVVVVVAISWAALHLR